MKCRFNTNHGLPYDPEFVLITLCRQCHKIEHKRLREEQKKCRRL